MSELVDAEARGLIRGALDQTFVVEAAAGTGKTTELVERILGVLRAGEPLEGVVAVTFTDKAAGEMKLRLREEIERARRDPATSAAERARLTQALEHLELARIATIHAFCADLLRERPVEAGIDPTFEMAAEGEAERYLEQAFELWFQQALDDPSPALTRVLQRRHWRESDDAGPRDLLLGAARELRDHRDFDAPWEVDVDFAREADVDALLDALRSLGDLSTRAFDRNDNLARNLAQIHGFVARLDERERLRAGLGARDYDYLEAALRHLLLQGRCWRQQGTRKGFGEGLSRDDVVARRAQVEDDLRRFIDRADADLAAGLQRDLREVVTAYEVLKARAGVLDFVDLLAKTRDLLRDDATVRAEYQSRFVRIFVDEFQDTDPLQAEVLLLLAASSAEDDDWRTLRVVPGKLFVVGDPKQSIYRFRRADVTVYDEVKDRLKAQGASVLELTTSFRARPGIQALINEAFGHAMAPGIPAQARYVPLAPHRPARPDQPQVVALSVPSPYGRRGDVVKYAVEDSTPDAVGAFVKWMLTDSGWKVEERGRDVDVRPEHVCLLFRRLRGFGGKDIAREYVRALEARRIPHVLLGGQGFHEREEVMALRAALAAIEWPDDELMVYAALRGAFFGLSDEQLFDYRTHVGRLHPLARKAGAEARRADREVAAALNLLARLHVERNRRPIAETASRFLEETRAHAGIAIWPTGEQALANVLRVVDHARRFDTRGTTSFRSFVDWLEDQAARGAGGDAPVVEDGTDGVRLMTVHKAKGLEFPIVVLCEPTAPRTRRFPSRFVDAKRGLWASSLAGCAPRELQSHAPDVIEADEAELVRVGYVAATRARDLLVVPAVGDEPVEGWVDLLHTALYPRKGRRRNAEPAPGCPPFGEDSVLRRSVQSHYTPGQSVRPGFHRDLAGGAGVVWWDPAVLPLDEAPMGGVRQQELLDRAGEDAAPAQRERTAHHKWRDDRQDVLERGATPTLRTRTITVAARDQTPDGGVVMLRTDVPREGRPRGARFGTLVHATLADVPLDADLEAIRALARLHGRLVHATRDEIEHAIDAVEAALAHPVLAAAAAAEEVRRESPVVLRGDDGGLVDGVVDLAFREGDRWTVVDFKTDLDDVPAEPYLVQVELYTRAIAAAMDAAAEGFLLGV